MVMTIFFLFLSFLFAALGFEFRASHLLVKHSYHLSHSARPFVCWVFLR
jgi:hypothetical protein